MPSRASLQSQQLIKKNMDYNKAIVVGNLTRDPDMRKTTNGTSICNIAIASNRHYKDKDGNKQSTVEYHNIVIFGRMGENVAQYMKKGDEMLVEGYLKTSSWEKDGVKKYRTDIIAENVQFGSKRNKGDQNVPQGTSDEGSQPEPPVDEDEIDISDIPF